MESADPVPWPLSPPPEATAGLTAPSRRYLRDARLAVVALALLLLLYFSLTGWFGYVTVTRILGILKGWTETPVLDGLVAIPAAFLFVVMVKGLFMVHRGRPSGLTRITAEDEPALMAFINRVADEAGAPRPHKVFLTAQVNAAVFYDLSWFDVLFPSRKNLLIGLGLVNALSLDEFKAVLAHEFGHFAQRTMRIGRWVYLTQQFVGELVVRRDGLDRFLDGVSRLDIRIAWVGWIMRLWVWSVRSVIEAAFRFVVLLDRSLSREMEFQADRVAVSLTGSDSLIHALHRLTAADVALDRAVHFALGELEQERAPEDLFALQSRIIEHLREVLHDPTFGLTPSPPTDRRADFRVFSPDLAEVPRMWSTHPANPDREASAKDRYLPSRLDGRSAWVLFTDPPTVRRLHTKRLLTAIVERDVDQFVATPTSLEELKRIFDRPHLARRFRGAWVERSLCLHTTEPDVLLDPDEAAQWSDAQLTAELGALYPETLRHDLERCEELQRELHQLQGLKDGILEAPGGVIRFRGRELRRRDLPKWIETVQHDAEAARDLVHQHDRRVRTAHFEAARRLDPSGAWPAYLASLLDLIHYAEHAEADLADALDHLENAVTMAMADASINQHEMRRIIAAAHEVHAANQSLYGSRDHVQLPIGVLDPWEIDSWAEALGGPYELPAPMEELLGDWFPVAEGYTRHGMTMTRRLARATLDVLIEAETWVEWAWQQGERPTDVPAPPMAAIPLDYPRRCMGDERPRIKSLTWWDKFILAEGPVAGVARFTVAVGILGPGLWATLALGGPALPWVTGPGHLEVHNGLGTAIDVTIAGTTFPVPPFATRPIEVNATRIKGETRGADGHVIETFDQSGPRHGETVTYNVARGSAGIASGQLHNDRFRPAEASVQWLDDVPPPDLVGLVAEHLDLTSVAEQVRAHLVHDPITSPSYADWIRAAGSPEFRHVVRLDDALAARQGLSVAARRAWMDTTTSAMRQRLCAEQAALADDAHPDATYFALRCRQAGPEAWATARSPHPHHGYLAFGHAAALSDQERYAEAAAALPLALLPREPAVALWRMRLARLADEPVQVEKLAERGSELAVLAEAPVEAPVGRSIPVIAWVFLRFGPDQAREIGMPELVDAWQAASGHDPPRFVPEPLPATVLWPALAGTLREGRDAAPIQTALAAHWPTDLSHVFGALEDLRHHGNPERFEAALGATDLLTRAHARLTAASLLGTATPPPMVERIRQALFWSERPHLDSVLAAPPAIDPAPDGVSDGPTAEP
ncbi:MAG: M48 family metalloprotease [Myxococcota bacterium]